MNDFKKKMAFSIDGSEQNWRGEAKKGCGYMCMCMYAIYFC